MTTHPDLVILTNSYDSHAEAVTYCIEGNLPRQSVFLMEMDTLATHCRTSLHVRDDVSLTVEDGLGKVDLLSASTVWFRRMPVFRPKAGIPDGFGEDAVEFGRRIMPMLSVDARWLNPFVGAWLASSKPLQLREAQRVGLSVPPTYLGNSAEDIRALASQGECIVKYSTPITFFENGRPHVVDVSALSIDDLQDEQRLEGQPAIYQCLVRKRAEVRALFFGNAYVAIELEHSPGDPIDFKAVAKSRRRGRLHQFPPVIRDQCLALMDRLQIRTGSFDLLIGEDGAYHFLEVNQAGQFLWMDLVVPEAQVLGRFSAFLTGRPLETFAVSSFSQVAGSTDFQAGFAQRRARLAAFGRDRRVDGECVAAR